MGAEPSRRARRAGRGPQGRRAGWIALAAVLVLGGIIASVFGARAVAQTESDRARLAFNLSSEDIASTLKLAIQHEEDLVVSASAFFTSNPGAGPLAFDRWAQAVRAMRRYPELQNIGLVALVPASRLHAFERRLAAQPVEPLGPHTASPSSRLQIFPPGQRPYYCIAVAGLARSRESYVPAGVDYCALAKDLAVAREQGVASYAPVMVGTTTTLGVQTPVYRGGAVPATVAGRRRAFVGWLGELLAPEVVLSRALEGHPGTAVRFSYESGSSHVEFLSGTVPSNAQASTVPLHNGWTVRSFGPTVGGSMFSDRNALMLLIGGILLSVLVGALTVVLATSRRRALSLVNEKTRELSHQALHDALTGLPNRALVMDRAAQMLARVGRQPGMRAGALFLDIDGFKHVNDKLGHAAGDRLLKVVGERLQECVRAQDTVGRLGGDEFVVLVESPSDDSAVDLLADRLIEAVRAPVELDDERQIFSVTASIGLALGQYSSADELLRDADLALYAAKAEGKDRYVLFDAGLYADAEGRVELELDLAGALREGQLFVLYQPIFDLRGRQVIGAEALVRWRHPERGVVGPDVFIPLAEEIGLIVPIGRWVLEQACRQAAAWSAQGHPLAVSVNVSAHQLGRRSFADDVRRTLADCGLDPSLLTLEITETTLMRDVTGASDRLREIRRLGVQIAIDDFGTGYASLSNLQRMPVDVLKVDRSFVAALSEGGRGRELLEAILGVGQALSLVVVAEGIELRSQMLTLEEMGCEMAQGFLMGRPTSPEEIEGILAANGGSRAADPRTV